MSMSLWDTERRAEKHHVFKNCRLNVVKPLPSFMSIIFILYFLCEFIPISNHIFCLSFLWHRFAIASQVERKSLADLKVGDQFSGQVVEVPLE